MRGAYFVRLEEQRGDGMLTRATILAAHDDITKHPIGRRELRHLDSLGRIGTMGRQARSPRCELRIYAVDVRATATSSHERGNCQKFTEERGRLSQLSCARFSDPAALRKLN